MAGILTLILLIFADYPKVEVKILDSIPDGIYQSRNMTIDENSKEIFILDSKACSVAIMNLLTRKNLVFGKRGQGPGEFQIPISLSVNDTYIIVGDIMKIHFLIEKIINISSQLKRLTTHQMLFFQVLMIRFLYLWQNSHLMGIVHELLI